MAQSTVQIREMTGADVEAVSGIRVRGWRWAYAGIVPQSYLDAMDPEADAAWRRETLARSAGRVRNLLAVVDGAPVGWAAFGPYRGEPDDAGDGELYALYVVPEHVGTGVGRALTSEVVRQTAELGRTRLLLWVLAENARARRFYAAAGFAPDGGETSDDYDGVRLREVRYARAVA
ncbi:GNAT family N-acetyltransferase [Actinacidiphila rubida]|uniref:Ribosomal protein S18 acetylase RimI n=1 Tax=Actinacidiphila rubida TaxID=310780 RepID=A0A1H8KXY3_9ACTN|nr:GNAT family N-acetyltransferase [Actinacidiphila rubida]SEN97278.1 Ribosomal protein S18 acetylase RimI [Actinacidiphila rubida]